MRRGGSSTEAIGVWNRFLVTGWVLGCFVAFDLVGVGLTLLGDMVGVLHRVWEGSSLLAYVIWFVVGVFCALCISSPSWTQRDDDHDSPEGRRRGGELLVITSVVAVVLGILSSFVWSDSGAGEAVAPDHRGLTITYLVTVVLVVPCARFVRFRERVRAEHLRAEPDSAEPAAESERCLPNEEGFSVAESAEPDRTDRAAFKPAGFWATVGLLIGVPVLLLLDASYLLFAPFDFFDRWMDPIFKVSLGGGLAWGFASARWRSPREWLLVLHAPQVFGMVGYILGCFPSALLLFFGAPEQVAEIVPFVGLGIGFLIGCGLVVVKFREIFDRAESEGVVRRTRGSAKRARRERASSQRERGFRDR